MRSILRRFHKKIFNVKSHFYMDINILCSHAFSTIKGLFFRWAFCILEPEKVLENKVPKWQDFIFSDFVFQGLFWRLAPCVGISEFVPFSEENGFASLWLILGTMPTILRQPSVRWDLFSYVTYYLVEAGLQIYILYR